MLHNAPGWTILSMSFVYSPKYLDWLWDPPIPLLNRHQRFCPYMGLKISWT